MIKLPGNRHEVEKMIKSICVYSSSSDAIDETYFAAAKEVGKQIGENGHTLIFGGGRIGLMGEVARTVHLYGGRVVGVIPEYLNRPNITYEASDNLIVTATMRERKAKMDEQSDAFLGLPGGFGTLEEILEIITLKQIQQHNKPIVLIDIRNFYKHLIAMFEEIYKERFAKEIHRQLYYVAKDVQDAFSYLNSYVPTPFPVKWF